MNIINTDPTDVRALSNTIYKDLLYMMDSVANKYASLSPEPDRDEYRRFIHFKQDVILKIGILTSQLVSQPTPVQMMAQNFIFAVYELHQFLIQLVIDSTQPTKEKILEMRSGLSVIHREATLFVQALDQTSP